MSDSRKGKASAYGQVSDSVEGKYDHYVPELIDNTQVQHAKLKDMAIGDPSLLASSNENVVPPPVVALIKPNSQLSESAAENMEPRKRKIDEKGLLKKQNLLLTQDSISFLLLSNPRLKFRNRETVAESFSVLVGTTWKKKHRDRGRGCRWRGRWQVVFRCRFAGLWRAEKG